MTTIKFDAGSKTGSATFENNNGTFSVTSGSWRWLVEDEPAAGTTDGVKTVTQNGNNLIIRYGFGNSDRYDTIFTFDKEDNSYSITGSDYFEISDITALEVNGTDIKSTLTTK